MFNVMSIYPSSYIVVDHRIFFWDDDDIFFTTIENITYQYVAGTGVLIKPE